MSVLQLFGKHIARVAGALTLLTLLFPAPLQAQATGEVSGRVTGPDGNAITVHAHD